VSEHARHSFKGRLEDRRLVSGRGLYVTDRNFPGQLHAAFVRADRAHAEILTIDARAALARPGVHLVLTGEDARQAGAGSLPTQLAVNGRDGKPLIKPFRPVLAQGKVRFVGECVACVVADSPQLAQDACEEVAVHYRDLPVVTVAEQALAAGAPQLHDNVPGNRVMDFAQGDEQKTAEAFRAAARIVRLSLYNNRVVGNPLEPRSAIAEFDPASGHHRFYSPTQGTTGMRAQLCGTLGIAQDKLDVIAQDVGGGFGVRSNVHPEYCCIVLAATKLGRPVKWTGTRSEGFLTDEQGRDVVSHGELALDAHGRFLAMRFDFITNLGAYCAPTGPFINSRVTACMTGVYDVPIAYARNQFVLTNTAPMAAYRGAGRPVMSSIIERLVTRAARETGIDEAELRRRNMIPRSAFPYTLVNGNVYDSGDPAGVLARAMEAARWTDRAALEQRRSEARSRGKLLGRGMASCIESTGAGAAAGDQGVIRFEDDGVIGVYAVSHSSGQGHETAFAQIIAGVLGVPLEIIRVREGDPRLRLVGNGSGGSRTTVGAGSVMLTAAREVVKKGLPLAAEKLEAAEADIEFADGVYRVKGTDRTVPLLELAHQLRGTQALDVQSQVTIGVTYPNGCHIAEVEIDPATGCVELKSYVACDDAGNIINHQLVEGQMHGGLTQGMGQVLGEYAIYDSASGQLLTGSFMDYPMPRAGFLKGVTLLDYPVPTATNPLGAKGVGESGVTGSLPTLMNAITDALAQAGVTHFDMPATPARVWGAIHAAHEGDPAALAIPQLS
jgi:carbon-monoxide dehydrogenase large subunit